MNWGTLAQAAGAMITSLVGLIGLGGRNHRRRVNIKANLELLDQLRESEWHETAFHNQVRVWLESRIGLDVAKLSGVKMRAKKPVPWGSVIFAALIAAAGAWGAYRLSASSFNWWSVPLWVLAGLMGIAVAGLFMNRDVRDEASPDAA